MASPDSVGLGGVGTLDSARLTSSQVRQMLLVGESHVDKQDLIESLVSTTS